MKFITIFCACLSAVVWYFIDEKSHTIVLPDLTGAPQLEIGCYQVGSVQNIRPQYSHYNGFPFSQKEEEVELCSRNFINAVVSSGISANNASRVHISYTNEEIFVIFHGLGPWPDSDFTVVGKQLIHLVDGLDEHSISALVKEEKQGRWVMHAKRIPSNIQASTQ